MPRAIVVNADDLGRSARINDGIFEAHRRGVVTSATLMVGAPAARDAAARLAEHPRLGVGLHVTLTGGGPPTLPPERVPSLLDAAGRLPRRPEGLAGAAPAEVLAEVRHQLALFEQLVGRAPTHLDSHHHSHRLPVVLDALIAAARTHALPVRRASEAVANRLAAAGIPTTAAFADEFYDEAATLDTLVEILAAAGSGVTEIMCHPGYSDDALRRDSTYADQRERELAVLTHPGAHAAVRGLGLRLTHFGAP